MAPLATNGYCAMALMAMKCSINSITIGTNSEILDSLLPFYQLQSSFLVLYMTVSRLIK
jgi:hypothetical protein